jgi:hypothetical protein
MRIGPRAPERKALQRLVCGGLGAALLASGATRAAEPPPAPAAETRPADETLRAIQERGRQVAEYLAAVDKARGRFAKDSQGLADPDTVVALEERDAWQIFFLKEAATQAAPGLPRQGTTVLAQTEFSAAADDVGQLRAMVPPHAAPATTVSYARALQLGEGAVAEQKGARGAHDAAVIREKDGTFSVYVQLRSEEPGRVRFGDDFVVRVAASGRQVQSVEALHLDEPVSVAESGRAAGQPTLHTHTKADLPTPTDVAQVRRHPGLAPHLVLTPHCMFRIDAAGALTYLGANAVAPAVPAAPGGGRGGAR